MNTYANGNSRSVAMRRLLPPLLIVAFASAFLAHLTAGKGMGNLFASISTPAPSSDLWTASQTVKPADLVKEMADAKGTNRPVVVCTGFPELYRGAHVPGAAFRGPASNLQALEDLKKWAQGVSRSSSVVIYCGCCPLDKCPNVRPAFEALHSMGFQHLRVLMLPNNFAKDWVSQGYPVEKGRPAQP